MTGINIIGDVAGNFLTLQALVQKMPEAPFVLVGDIIDRGPRSKEVIEWCMQSGATVLLGNHELMMLEWLERPKINQTLMWVNNGGGATLKCFEEGKDADGRAIYGIDSEIKEWLNNLPLFYETDDVLVSHAPIIGKEWAPDFDPSGQKEWFVWNRYAPQRKSKYQVFGHNSHFGLKRLSDDHGEFAMCIDTSASEILTGLHWPSKEIFQQPYLDKEVVAAVPKFKPDENSEEW